MTNKQEILEGIQRIAQRQGGRAPGKELFETETGISRSDWYPHMWLRWGDALREAGFEPNKFTAKWDERDLITRLINLAREVGRFPIEGELRLKRKEDQTFPSHTAFGTLGNKSTRAKKVLAFCSDNPEFSDVAEMARAALSERKPPAEAPSHDLPSSGYVYLIRLGARTEYKIGRTIDPLRREGEIGVLLPEKGIPIHTIETDDPAGIERYWHTRFKEKRKNGEWFNLSADDVKAFKRWRKIY
jgi:hypothetical protein